jgi:LysM repeat protein
MAYKIKRGDTLSKIAKESGVSIKQLMEWNKTKIKEADRIYEGDSIELSAPAPARKSQAQAPRNPIASAAEQQRRWDTEIASSGRADQTLGPESLLFALPMLSSVLPSIVSGVVRAAPIAAQAVSKPQTAALLRRPPELSAASVRPQVPGANVPNADIASLLQARPTLSSSSINPAVPAGRIAAKNLPANPRARADFLPGTMSRSTEGTSSMEQSLIELLSQGVR